MTNAIKAPTGADYERYDRVWQRVAPDACGKAVQTFADETATVASDGTCCMGAGAEGMTGTIEGYIADELADSAFYTAFAAKAPNNSSRAAMRTLAAAERGHARKLMAAYYLITGKYYTLTPTALDSLPSWREGLRLRYHAETCGAMAYETSAADTTDMCLRKLFEEMSIDEYSHSDKILSLLASLF
ncbi:MAG: ferritin-like domain-containing protein [Oscillospiraceae bacterium]|nr:ferritin-like domain-containing protein [Oscillospiraceae bacterium]